MIFVCDFFVISRRVYEKKSVICPSILDLEIDHLLSNTLVLVLCRKECKQMYFLFNIGYIIQIPQPAKLFFDSPGIERKERLEN